MPGGEAGWPVGTGLWGRSRPANSSRTSLAHDRAHDRTATDEDGMSDARVAAALARTRPVPFWLDQPAPEPEPALRGKVRADLVFVCGGVTGVGHACQARRAGRRRSV